MLCFFCCCFCRVKKRHGVTQKTICSSELSWFWIWFWCFVFRASWELVYNLLIDLIWLDSCSFVFHFCSHCIQPIDFTEHWWAKHWHAILLLRVFFISDFVLVFPVCSRREMKSSQAQFDSLHNRIASEERCCFKLEVMWFNIAKQRTIENCKMKHYWRQRVTVCKTTTTNNHFSEKWICL